MPHPDAGLHRFARVLIIDDDFELLRGICLSLRKDGYDVSTACSGTNALELIAHVRPHVLVLDVMMPGVDGWEVLQRVRENLSTADLPVLMLTAKDSEESTVLGFTLGADDYLTKPFRVAELRCRVGALLRRARSGGEAESDTVKIPVASGSTGHEFVESSDVYYIDGVRNYTYVHSYDGRFLSRLGLGEMEQRVPGDFVRVHRSYIVNLDTVKGCRWATHSSYRLVLSDLDNTEVPVSRALVSDIQQRLGVK